ncbi:hypothetical protein BH09MYX1_BH09MYX1_22540 [soil metagenome]
MRGCYRGAGMSARTPDYQPGQLIPGTIYKVHRVLGAGGMGTVYDVEDTSVGRRYVLKTLHADLADRADLAARLSREARALAKLQHPNIVEVYTSGTTQDLVRLPFYVMERLQGQSLRVALERRGRLTLEQSYDIAIDLLDALDHAHEYGIVHRDVKPDNIFLTRGRDGRALAKLLDFGIIKLNGGSTLHTGGRFIGTFRYAPPEQILGKDVSAQSDLYSAGLVLYEMIAGRGPFDDFAGEVEIGKAHIDVSPPSISRFAQVPPELEALLTSALAKRLELRPASAHAFATSLRELKRQLVGHISRANNETTSAPVVSSVPDTSRQANAAVAGQEQLPPSDGSTLPDTPQARVGPTVAAAGGQTVIMGPPRGMAPPGAPTMEPPPTAPTLLVRPAVDRSAETREAQPIATPAPSNDTAMIAPPAPAAPAAPAPAFAAAEPKPLPLSTVPISPRKSGGTSWVVVGVGALVLVIVLAVGGFVARRVIDERAHATPATATNVMPPPDTSTASTGPVASGLLSATVATSAIPTIVDPSAKPAASVTHAPTPSVRPSATARASATVPATGTATGTATVSGSKRPGSGL